jgi:shikimate dehydrogenase
MIPAPSGTTRVAGLLGYPAAYSLSPALHNAAYMDLGLDVVYTVFPTKAEHLRDAVAAVRALNLLGVSVTIPHKETIVALCDEVAPAARSLGAVNCIARDGDRLVGHNTDGAGFVSSLRNDLRFDPGGERCVVIGGGGAAKAVIAALAEHGATEVIVVNRSLARAQEAAAVAGATGRTGNASDVPEADLVVNATPLGMVGEYEGLSPVDASLLRSHHVVVDLVYQPKQTRLLLEAEAAGARVANGLGMLIHQAAAQIEIWTGQRPSIPVMRAAVE